MKNRYNKNSFYASLGSALEYFDFAVFGLLYVYLTEIFFDNSDKFSSEINSLLVYSIGFFARPVGGVIAGVIGDFYGRRIVFMTLTGVMSLATLAIGCLLPYGSIGIWASILLSVLRILQGCSFGGEIAGASTIIEESSSKGRRSMNFSMMISGTAIGALAANGLISYLKVNLSHQEILEYGWRIPFILGGLLGIILWFLRQNIVETLDLNKEERYAKESTLFIFLKSLRTYKSNLLLSAGLCFFTSALLITNIFFPVILGNYFGQDPQLISLYTTYSLAFSVIICPIIGYLIKMTSKYKYIEFIQLLYIATVFPTFIYLKHCSGTYLMIFLFIQQFFITSMFIGQSSIISSIFPSSIRYTAVSITLNLVSAVASLLLIVYKNMYEVYSYKYMIPAFLSIVCMISLISNKLLYKRIE